MSPAYCTPNQTFAKIDVDNRYRAECSVCALSAGGCRCLWAGTRWSSYRSKDTVGEMGAISISGSTGSVESLRLVKSYSQPVAIVQVSSSSCSSSSSTVCYDYGVRLVAVGSDTIQFDLQVR